MMTDQEYVAAAGQHCPYCQSTEIDVVGQPDFDGRDCWQGCHCESCGQEWTDHYQLAGYAPVEPENETVRDGLAEINAAVLRQYD